MKRRFAKFVLILISVVTISLSCVPESKAHLFANLFGYGRGHSSYSGYRGYGFSAYRPSYYGPRTSYYHAPVNSYGRSSFYSGRGTGLYPLGRGHSSCGCNSCGSSPCSGGCISSFASCGSNPTGGCSNGNCATGNCSVGNNSPTPVDEDYGNNPTYKKDPTVIKKYNREDKKEDIDKTGSKQFVPSKEEPPLPKKDDSPFGNSKGLNDTNTEENPLFKKPSESKDDGLDERRIEEELPLQEDPKLPEEDPFGSDKEEEKLFKIPAKKQPMTEAEKLDKVFDDFRKQQLELKPTERKTEKVVTPEAKGKTIIKQKGAPTKSPVEEEKSFLNKKTPAEMPRLEIDPIGLQDKIAWKTIPTYRRLKIRSRYSAPQIARVRITPGQSISSPYQQQPETKLVSR